MAFLITSKEKSKRYEYREIYEYNDEIDGLEAGCRYLLKYSHRSRLPYIERIYATAGIGLPWTKYG